MLFNKVCSFSECPVPSLHVRSTTSAFIFKGKIQVIGEGRYIVPGLYKSSISNWISVESDGAKTPLLLGSLNEAGETAKELSLNLETHLKNCHPQELCHPSGVMGAVAMNFWQLSLKILKNYKKISCNLADFGNPMT